MGKALHPSGTLTSVHAQVKSQLMSIKLANRRTLEQHLGSFIEHLTVSEAMVATILDGPVGVLGRKTHTRWQWRHKLSSHDSCGLVLPVSALDSLRRICVNIINLVYCMHNMNM